MHFALLIKSVYFYALFAHWFSILIQQLHDGKTNTYTQEFCENCLYLESSGFWFGLLQKLNRILNQTNNNETKKKPNWMFRFECK